MADVDLLSDVLVVESDFEWDLGEHRADWIVYSII